MKTSARRKLGAVILGASLVAGVALLLAGTSLVSVDYSHAETPDDGNFMWSYGFGFHWPFIALLATGVIGLLLLIRGHEKTNT